MSDSELGVGGKNLIINGFVLIFTQIEMFPQEVTSYLSILISWIDSFAGFK